MPAFVKTPADEKKWAKIKGSVMSNPKYASLSEDRKYAITNAAFHGRTKQEGNPVGPVMADPQFPVLKGPKGVGHPFDKMEEQWQPRPTTEAETSAKLYDHG